MKIKKWGKIVVVAIVILVLILSYSAFFIPLGLQQQSASPQEFKGPTNSPVSGDFKEPAGAPKVNLPTTPPPTE